MTGHKSHLKSLHRSDCSWCRTLGSPGAAFAVAVQQCGSQHRLAFLLVLVVLAPTATLPEVPALTYQQAQAVQIAAFLDKLTIISVEPRNPSQYLSSAFCVQRGILWVLGLLKPRGLRMVYTEKDS